jgi:hypothetical protein
MYPPPRRYVLVPDASRNGSSHAIPITTSAQVRRYRLARVGVSRRSALGVDRHERLERVAEASRGQPD